MTAFDQLKQTLHDASREARRLAKQRGAGTTNVAIRRNVNIASNVGRGDAVERVTSIQDAPIVQRGGATTDNDDTAA